jgi:ABC-type glycerol-3-phosphate transport system substrate-binding protein
MFVTFLAKDALLPLNGFIDRDPSFQVSDFFPEVLQRFTREGKLYAIPRDTAPFACVFYNKRLFDEARLPYPSDDWTLDELLQTAKRLTKREKDRVTQYGFYAWAWQNFVYAHGGRLVDDLDRPTRCVLDDPRAIAGLQFYADLMNAHQVAPTPNALGNLAMGAQQLFMSQRVAMFSSGIWETPILRRIRDFDWDVAMFPKGPSGERAFGTGGTGYCILRSSKHPQAAWEVLKALAGDEGHEQLAEKGLAQPANRRIAQGPAWAESPLPPRNKRMLNEAVRYAVYEPTIPEWREIADLHMLPELDLVFNGQQSAAEAVARIVPKVNAALAKRHATRSTFR